MLQAEVWSNCSGINFSIRGAQRYKAADFAIEGDWSAAANFFVAGAVFGSAEIRGMDTKSLQADLTIVDILVDAGAILEMLGKMGVEARIEGDDMFICGESLTSRLLGGRLLRGGEYTSRHDHRMVMALKVASLGADSPVIIDDEACVEKSFPDFLKIF